MTSMNGEKTYHVFGLFGCCKNKFLTGTDNRFLYLYINKTILSFTILINLILLIALHIGKVVCFIPPSMNIHMQAICNTLILLFST